MLNNYDIDYNRYADSDVFGTSVPSVYISNIDISENTDSTTFKVKLCVFERSDASGSFLWYTNDLIRGYLNIKVKINDEQPFATMGIVKQEDIDQYVYETLPDGTTVYKIVYEAETSIKLEGRPNISISSYIEIDMTTAYQDYGAGGLPYLKGLTEREILSFSQGPIDSTVVYSNGILVRTKKAWFTNPGGKLWLGLRHEHQGRTMAGPKHTSTSHPFLSSQLIANGVYYATSKQIIETIIDFSQDEQLSSLLNIDQQTNRSSYSSLITSESYISDLYTTRAATSGGDRNDVITSYFSIDISKFAIQNSRYGYVYSFLSPSIKEQLLRSTEIINFRVFRHRNDIENVTPELIVESRDQPGVPLSFKNTLQLREQQLYTNDSTIRTFELNDYEVLSKKTGEYVYEITVSLIDPIYDFFADMYQQINTLLANLEDFLQLASTTYNHTFNTLDKSVIGTIMNLPAKQRPSAIAQDVINTFFNTFNFPKASKSMLNMLSSSISLYLSPETATLESIEQTIEIFQVLSSNLQGFVSTRDYDSINKTNVSGKTAAASNYLQINYKFDLFDVSDHISYIKFVDISHSLNGLIVNTNNLKALYDSDVSQYISNPPALGSTTARSRLSFFSVKNISIDGSTYSIGGWSGDSISELQALNFFGQSDTMRSLESGFTGLEAAEILTQYGISVEIPGVTGEVVLNVMANLGAGSTAGEATEFDLDALSSLYINEEIASIYKNLATRWPADQGQVSFDYFAPDAIGSGRDSVQSKSLIYALGLDGLGTPSDFNRSSLAAEVSNDPQTNINSQQNKFLIYLKYGTMGKIEYLSSNNGAVGDAKWTQLTAKSSILNLPPGSNFLCRVSRTTSYGYPKRSADVFDLSIKNQYFILQISG